MCRSFTSDPVEPDLVDRLVDLASRAPSAGKTQGWHLVVLEGDHTEVPIRVRSRLPGDTPLRVRVTTPDGAVLLSEGTYSVRSTAVSGVGLVLTVGAGLFLAVWWGRHILRSRRHRGRHAR